MSTTIKLDPITRIEGHLAVKVNVDQGKVAEAYCLGEMFRGFETILMGRDPLDAQQITQRICGVCPISHGIASIRAQEDAYKLTPARNGVLLRNLILGANYLQSHIIHFYQLCALDFVDLTAITSYTGNDPQLNELKAWVQSETSRNEINPATPFLPRYKGDYLADKDINLGAIKHYLQALNMRRMAHEAAAIFCGKIPHAAALVPGGVSNEVTMERVLGYTRRLRELKTFVDTVYAPDVLAVAKAYPQYFQLGKGTGNFMAYGVFPDADNPVRFMFPAGTVSGDKIEPLDTGLITEEVQHAYFSSGTGLHPSKGETTPDPNKPGAYSWSKAPRYRRQPMEVGALARVLIAYQSQANPELNRLVDTTLAQLGKGPADLNSVMGRHAARALEAKLIADQCLVWAGQLRLNESACTDFTLPKEGRGMGLIEAPRGALGHWIEIANHKIARYQCVVPTTWNCSPRDDNRTPGPVEQSLVGAPIADPDNPIEAARVVRSFDPCLACAIH